MVQRSSAATDSASQPGSPIKVKKNRTTKSERKQKQRANAAAQSPPPRANGGNDGGGGSRTGKGSTKGGGKGTAQDRPKAPPEEWRKIMNLCPVSRKGKKVCAYFNCSVGCRYGDDCDLLHECLVCSDPGGCKHPWFSRHQ